MCICRTSKSKATPQPPPPPPVPVPVFTRVELEAEIAKRADSGNYGRLVCADISGGSELVRKGGFLGLFVRMYLGDAFMSVTLHFATLH
jgi:hypothetical protein